MSTAPLLPPDPLCAVRPSQTPRYRTGKGVGRQLRAGAGRCLRALSDGPAMKTGSGMLRSTMRELIAVIEGIRS